MTTFALAPVARPLFRAVVRSLQIARRLLERSVTAVTWLLSWLVPRNPALWVFGSGYGRRFADNPKYAFLRAVHAPPPGVTACWITASPVVARELRALGLPVRMRWSARGCWAMLRAGVWWMDCRTTDLGVVSARGALRVNLWHGIPLKRIERDIQQPDHPCALAHHGPWWRRAAEWLLRPHLTERYDVIPATGAECARRLGSAFGLPPAAVPVLGFPRNDVLFDPARAWPLDGPTGALVGEMAALRRAGQRLVLYMPTFRDSDASATGPLDWAVLGAMLEAEAAVCYVKLHPSDRAGRGSLPAGHPRLRVVDPRVDVYPALAHVACLVSDYSSIVFDYLLLNRPVVHFAHDVAAYQAESRGLYEPFADAAVGAIAEDTPGLITALRAAVTGQEAPAHAARRRAQAERLHGARDAGATDRCFAHVRARLGYTDRGPGGVPLPPSARETGRDARGGSPRRDAAG